MNKSIEEYLKYVYYSDRDLNNIYTILALLNKNDENYEWLNTSLINEQLAIKNDYNPNNNGHVFPYESWLGLNVQSGKTYEEFENDVNTKSTKIYVSLDKNKVKEITSGIFKFLSDNNIECQSKIGKNLRTDTLTIRVCNKEDAQKVVDFINGMDYTPNIHPNPFLLNKGKVSIARDGGAIPYNQVLSNYICDYFYYHTEYNQNHNDFKDISCNDFLKFIEKELASINKDKEPDLYMVTDLIYRNATGTLTLEDIVNYGEIKEKKNSYNYNSNNSELNNTDKSEEYITLMSRLSNYYDNNKQYMVEERKEIFDSGIEYAHAVIDMYMKTGNIGFFTQKAGNIRNFVQNNFDLDTMKETVTNIGWNSIIKASKETIQKYNNTVNITGTSTDEGVIEIILKSKNNKEIFSLFTNDNNVRSRLGYLISPSMAKDILVSKLNKNPYSYHPKSDELKKDISAVTDLVLNEVFASNND